MSGQNKYNQLIFLYLVSKDFSVEEWYHALPPEDQNFVRKLDAAIEQGIQNGKISYERREKHEKQ